jgi:hypothetical protein
MAASEANTNLFSSAAAPIVKAYVRPHPVLWWILAFGATLALAFQIGHFAEHAVQLGVWIIDTSSRTTPWMSQIAMTLVHAIGTTLFPELGAQRQMMLGMEVLHLIGNGIFLGGLGCLYYCLRSKYVRWALYVEGFHLCEHIALTFTVLYLGMPIGLSTLLGHAKELGGQEFAVGFRVSWHFLMNLLPMPLAMAGLMAAWKQSDYAWMRPVSRAPN